MVRHTWALSTTIKEHSWTGTLTVTSRGIIDTLKAGIQQLQYHSGFTDRALEKAWDEMFEPGKGAKLYLPRVLLVITDGKTNAGSEKYEGVLEPLVVIKSQTPELK